MKILTLPTFALIGATALSACGGSDEPESSVSDERRSEVLTMSSAYEDQTADTLRSDSAAMALAGDLYMMECASCHGDDGRGRKGITDLVRGKLSYGATADAIRTTIRDGRVSEMPGLGSQYGEVDLGQIVAYVETLGTENVLSDYELRGREFFNETCAACHGADGRGQAAIGAPDLTDAYWQHGDSMMSIRLTITRGANAQTPAFGETLTPAQIELLTAYVLNLAAG